MNCITAYNDQTPPCMGQGIFQQFTERILYRLDKTFKCSVAGHFIGRLVRINARYMPGYCMSQAEGCLIHIAPSTEPRQFHKGIATVLALRLYRRTIHQLHALEHIHTFEIASHFRAESANLNGSALLPDRVKCGTQ